MPDERQNIIVANWHSLAVETSRGKPTATHNHGKRAPDGIGIAAVQLGEGEAGEVILMLGITKGGLSLAAPLRLEEWNRFGALAQLALMDAAKLELARRGLAMEEPQRGAPEGYQCGICDGPEGEPE